MDNPFAPPVWWDPCMSLVRCRQLFIHSRRSLEVHESWGLMGPRRRRGPSTTLNFSLERYPAELAEWRAAAGVWAPAPSRKSVRGLPPRSDYLPMDHVVVAAAVAAMTGANGGAAQPVTGSLHPGEHPTWSSSPAGSGPVPAAATPAMPGARRWRRRSASHQRLAPSEAAPRPVHGICWTLPLAMQAVEVGPASARKQRRVPTGWWSASPEPSPGSGCCAC